MPASKVSKGQHDDTIRELHSKGWTQAEIGAVVGAAQGTVGNRLRALMVPAHKPGRLEASIATIQAHNATIRNHHVEQDGVMGKVCRKCDQWRPLDHFTTSANTWDGSENRCRECNLARKRELYDPEEGRVRRAANRERMRPWFREYERNKLATDMDFRLKRRIRHAVYRALKGMRKEKPTMALLGCSIEELREHLEHQFTEGMTWDNYGRGGWELDHIKPIASFDFTDQAQVEECFHYTNLQPLWGPDNWSKGAKLL